MFDFFCGEELFDDSISFDCQTTIFGFFSRNSNHLEDEFRVFSDLGRPFSISRDYQKTWFRNWWRGAFFPFLIKKVGKHTILV